MAANASSRSCTSPRSSRPAGSVGNASQSGAATVGPIEHAVRIVHAVCCLAGALNMIDDVQVRLGHDGVTRAIRNQDTDVIFDWLVGALSYQGISDDVATKYMMQHGRARWRAIEASLEQQPGCPKLTSYWHMVGCQYRKTDQTCAEPRHFDSCPLPRYALRNGRLNQTAYSLYFFIRDYADGDIVSWIDEQLRGADLPHDRDRHARMRASLLDPLRNVYGLSDKVLMMALSDLLLAAPQGFEHWREVGGTMIAIDTLVHNFLDRTGILRRFKAGHHYGPGCYGADGCAAIMARVAERIDACAFNPAFPKVFPRFIQHAIWRYCAQLELDVCNGNRINDRKSCDNIYCQIRRLCDRVGLAKLNKR